MTKLNASGSGLAYSTYLGGNGTEIGTGIALDAAGSAYVTGHTESRNFPTANAYQGGIGDDPYGVRIGDAFVTKLAPAGNALAYSSYLGGGDRDEGLGIAVDAARSAYVTGWTGSTDYPIASPLQVSTGGGDAFVTKLNDGGSALLYSTYLGGNGSDTASAIAVDAAGAAYVSGSTWSTNFPTASAYQGAKAGDQSTADVFVSKLAPGGSALAYSTFLGGSGNDYGDAMAIDAAGSAYVAGLTDSPNFPTSSGAFDTTIDGTQDAFVTKLAQLPTSVLLHSLVARGSSHGVLLWWRSDYEAGLVGFNIYRDQSRLNRVLIRTHARASGNSYRYVDRTAPRGVPLRYRLQAVSLGGTRVWLGTAVARR